MTAALDPGPNRQISREKARRYNQRPGSVQQTQRTHEEFARFLAALDLVEPGVVPLPQ